ISVMLYAYDLRFLLSKSKFQRLRHTRQVTCRQCTETGCICCNQSDKWMMPESHDNHRSKRRQYDRTCISRHVSDDADEDDRRNDESGRRNLDDASHGHFEITRFLSKPNTDHDNEHHAERGKFTEIRNGPCQHLYKTFTIKQVDRLDRLACSRVLRFKVEQACNQRSEKYSKHEYDE